MSHKITDKDGVWECEDLGGGVVSRQLNTPSQEQLDRNVAAEEVRNAPPTDEQKVSEEMARMLRVDAITNLKAAGTIAADFE